MRRRLTPEPQPAVADSTTSAPQFWLTPGPDNCPLAPAGAPALHNATALRVGIAFNRAARLADVRRDAVFSSTGQRMGSPENRHPQRHVNQLLSTLAKPCELWCPVPKTECRCFFVRQAARRRKPKLWSSARRCSRHLIGKDLLKLCALDSRRSGVWRTNASALCDNGKILRTKTVARYV